MVECAQTLRCFSKIGVFTENIPVGFFRLSETTKNFQARRVMAAVDRVNSAFRQSDLNQGERDIPAIGMKRCNAFGVQ